jgi:hypothetical protein
MLDSLTTLVIVAYNYDPSLLGYVALAVIALPIIATRLR